MECIPKKDIQRIAYFDAYQSFQRQFPHEDAHETRIRTSQYLRPKFHMDTNTYARENSGLAEYDVPEATFTLTSDGHIYYTQYNQQLLELHERQRRLTPDTYSPREHAISLLIETHFANGASIVVNSYGERDLLILQYDHESKIGTTSVINTQHAEGGSSPLTTIEQRFPNLIPVSPTEGIVLHTDKPLTITQAQEAIQSLYPVKHQHNRVPSQNRLLSLTELFHPIGYMPQNNKLFNHATQQEIPVFSRKDSPVYITHATQLEDTIFQRTDSPVHNVPSTQYAKAPSLPIPLIQKDTTALFTAPEKKQPEFTKQNLQQKIIDIPLNAQTFADFPQNSSFPITQTPDAPNTIVFSTPYVFFWERSVHNGTKFVEQQSPEIANISHDTDISIPIPRERRQLHHGIAIPTSLPPNQSITLSQIIQTVIEHTPLQHDSHTIGTYDTHHEPTITSSVSQDLPRISIYSSAPPSMGEYIPRPTVLHVVKTKALSIRQTITSTHHEFRILLFQLSTQFNHRFTQQIEASPSTFHKRSALLNFLKKATPLAIVSATIRQRTIPMMHADAPKRIQQKIPTFFASLIHRFRENHQYMFLHG